MSEDNIKKEEAVETAAEKRKRIEKERREQIATVTEVLQEHKGKLELTTPILANDEELTEVEYDFNRLTGLEVANAMDSDSSSSTVYRISYRQSLALFAAAVAKVTPELDQRDVLERLGAQDTIMGVQLAVRFFNNSTSTARLRISKRSRNLDV